MKWIFGVLALALSCGAMAEERTWKSVEQTLNYATGYKPNKSLHDRAEYKSFEFVDVKIPDHFDWRKVGSGLPDVKAQGGCGSCWAFASTAVMESVLKLTGVPQDLSEQYLVSCDKDFYGCDGGDVAFDMFVDPGTVSADQMPYTATDGKCKQGLRYGESIPSWSYVDGRGQGIPPALDIAKAIYLYGPVTTAVAVDNKFQSYSSGIYNSNTAWKLNHLVALVGYDIPGQYWILRNSWGKGWGEEGGYMRIKWGVDKVGSEAAFLRFRLPVPNGQVEPTPTPQPTVEPTPKPCSPQAHAAIKASASVIKLKPLFKTKLVLSAEEQEGQTYLWRSNMSDSVWTTPKVVLKPNKRGDWVFSLIATTECGTAEDSVTITVK